MLKITIILLANIAAIVMVWVGIVDMIKDLSTDTDIKFQRLNKKFEMLEYDVRRSDESLAALEREHTRIDERLTSCNIELDKVRLKTLNPPIPSSEPTPKRTRKKKDTKSEH